MKREYLVYVALHVTVYVESEAEVAEAVREAIHAGAYDESIEHLEDIGPEEE